MSIIVTNELTIPTDRAEAVAAKFARNSEDLHRFDGFEQFRLCRPSEGERWLVITQWRDEAAYTAWRDSHTYRAHHPREGQSQREQSAQSVITHYRVQLQRDADGSSEANRSSTQ